MPDRFTVVHPQNNGIGDAMASGFALTESVSVITWLHPGTAPVMVNTVVTAGKKVCVAKVESANGYAGDADHIYVVAPLTVSVAESPAQMFPGPPTVMFNPGVIVNVC